MLLLEDTIGPKRRREIGEVGAGGSFHSDIQTSVLTKLFKAISGGLKRGGFLKMMRERLRDIFIFSKASGRKKSMKEILYVVRENIY